MRKIIFRVKQWYIKNLGQVMLLVLVLLAFEFFSKFPYLNILFTFPYPWNSLLVLWIMSLLLFHLSPESSYIAAAGATFIAIIFLVLQKNHSAETLGEIVFVLLTFGLVQHISLYLRDKRRLHV